MHDAKLNITYLKVFQIFRYNVCPDFLILDKVAAMLGMPAHRSGTCALVVSSVYHFGRKSETAEATEKRCSGLHIALLLSRVE